MDWENIQWKFQFPKQFENILIQIFMYLMITTFQWSFRKIQYTAVNLQYLKVYRYPKTNSLPRSTQLDCICITALWLVKRSMTSVSFERVSLANIHAIYEVSISYGSKVIAKVKVFRYVCQRSLSRSLGQNPWQDQKALSQRMYILNIKALPLMVQRLKFLEM